MRDRRQLLLAPYNFDFLTLATDAHEREAEARLMTHIASSCWNSGVGFAFVGQQYPLEVDGEEFSIDLLFYHRRLHCYFVIDLKMRSFESLNHVHLTDGEFQRLLREIIAPGVLTASRTLRTINTFTRETHA